MNENVGSFSMGENRVLLMRAMQEDTLSKKDCFPLEPVSCISVEVAASWPMTTNSMVAGAVSELLALDSFEPTRCLQDLSPPKKFYRTFWRSVSNRLVALSRTKIIIDEEGSRF